MWILFGLIVLITFVTLAFFRGISCDNIYVFRTLKKRLEIIILLFSISIINASIHVGIINVIRKTIQLIL